VNTAGAPGALPAPGPPGAAAASAPEPAVRVLRGAPTPEEVAALVAAVALVGAAGSPGSAAGPESRRGSAWSAPASRLRVPHRPAPGAWRSSVLPR